MDDKALEDLVDRVARKAVDEAVPRAIRHTLLSMGLDSDHPLDAQRDAQFLRATRKRCEQAGGKGLMVLVALIVAGTVAAVWDSLRRSI